MRIYSFHGTGRRNLVRALACFVVAMLVNAAI